MPRFKRGIQYSLSLIVLTASDTDYWIARSSRAMTAIVTYAAANVDSTSLIQYDVP
jgi:hypothetical protein